MIRILIIDDSACKCNWIKELLNYKKIEYEEATYLNKAFEMMKSTKYDGIILDMQFPILKNGEIEKRAGQIFLKKIKNIKIEIPVLGNSMSEFSNTEGYPFFVGKINGIRILDEGRLLEFLKSIEERSV